MNVIHPHCLWLPQWPLTCKCALISWNISAVFPVRRTCLSKLGAHQSSPSTFPQYLQMRSVFASPCWEQPGKYSALTLVQDVQGHSKAIPHTGVLPLGFHFYYSCIILACAQPGLTHFNWVQEVSFLSMAWLPSLLESTTRFLDCRHDKQWPPSGHRSLQLFSWRKFWTGSSLTSCPRPPSKTWNKFARRWKQRRKYERLTHLGLLSLATSNSVWSNSASDDDHHLIVQNINFWPRVPCTRLIFQSLTRASKCISLAQLVSIVKLFPMEHCSDLQWLQSVLQSNLYVYWPKLQR